MVSALSESPLAVAAAANLRATTTVETIGYNLKVGALTNATTWYLEAGKLHNAEGYKVTDALALNDEVAGADFTYENNHLKSGDKYLVFTNEGKLELKTTPAAGDSYATFFTSAGAHQPSVADVDNYIGVIGAESLNYAIGNNGLHLTAPTLTLGWNTSISDITALQKVAKLEKVNGFLLLKIATEGGNEKYVVSDGTNVTLKDEMPESIVKSVVTFTTTGNKIQLGGHNLYFDGTAFALAGTRLVSLVGDEADATSGTWMVAPADGGETKYHIIIGGGADTNPASLVGYYSMTYTASDAGVSNVAAASATALTVAGDANGFTLSNGLGYLKDNGQAGEVGEAAAFKLDADGAVMQGTNYLQKTSTGYTVAALNASNEKVYLYSATTEATPLTTVEAASTVYAATAVVTVKNAETVAYAYPQTETTTTTEPDWTLKVLEDGTSYYIGSDSKYLSLNTAGTALIASSEGQLWKVSVVDAGAGKLYSFTNQYGQALVFNVKDNVVTYAADGKYSQFLREQVG